MWVHDKSNQTLQHKTKPNKTNENDVHFLRGRNLKKKSQENRKFYGANSYDRWRSEKCKRMLWCHKKFQNACEIVVKICLGKCDENSNDSEFCNVENTEWFFPNISSEKCSMLQLFKIFFTTDHTNIWLTINGNGDLKLIENDKRHTCDKVLHQTFHRK